MNPLVELIRRYQGKVQITLADLDSGFDLQMCASNDGSNVRTDRVYISYAQQEKDPDMLNKALMFLIDKLIEEAPKPTAT